MANPYLRSRLEERAKLADLIGDTLQTAAEAHRDVSDDEKKLLDKWEIRCANLDEEIKRLETMERGNHAFESVMGRLAMGDEQQERRSAAERNKPPVEERKSVGQLFVESDVFKNYTGHGSMAPFEIESDRLMETRAAITTADLPIQPYLYAANPPVSRTPLLDLIGHERVSSGAVEYIVWGTSAGEASEVDEGDLKPEAPFDSSEETEKLATYAWYKAITRQALEDYPRIQSIVEGKLRIGLANKLEKEAAAIINGGTFNPIVNADLLAGIRQAVGEVQELGFQPNAVLLNPADYANLDISAATASNSGPTSYGNYWGLRPVAAGAVPEGAAYVADFTQAVTWFDRNVSKVYMTDSHADFFLRNQLVILAETRALFAITDLDAIAKVTTTAPAPGAATAKGSK